jgi:hypothetical protein
MLQPDRLILVALIGLALAVSARRSIVITGACLTQLTMILIDPSPFQYVYGWSAVPVIIGICRFAPRLSVIAAAAPPALSLAAGIGYVVVKGHEPPPGSSLRLTLDAPIGDPRRLDTPALVALMVSSDGQQALWNQLAIRAELCRRIHGSVLSVFSSHPICLFDSSFDWVQIRWKDPRAMVERGRPELYIWGQQFDRQTRNAELPKGYVSFGGFALSHGMRDYTSPVESKPVCTSEQTGGRAEICGAPARPVKKAAISSEDRGF